MATFSAIYIPCEILNSSTNCKSTTTQQYANINRDKFGFILYIHHRLAPMWQQSGTLLFCSCHGIAGFLVDELQI